MIQISKVSLTMMTIIQLYYMGMSHILREHIYVRSSYASGQLGRQKKM